MPLLSRGTRTGGRALPHPAWDEAGRDTGRDGSAMYPGGPRATLRSGMGLFETCANPACRSGWLHLWRSRSAPVFEGGWNCSAECTLERMQTAVRRELDGRGSVQDKHRHRVPLGLLMLEQGWITAGQLRGALEAQKTAGSGRLGYWLVGQQGVSEQLMT